MKSFVISVAVLAAAMLVFGAAFGAPAQEKPKAPEKPNVVRQVQMEQELIDELSVSSCKAAIELHKKGRLDEDVTWLLGFCDGKTLQQYFGF